MKEQMKKQAVKMMTKLGVHEPTIRQFDEEGLVSMTLGSPANFWVDEDVKKDIKEIEDKYGCLVYYAVKSVMRIDEYETMEMISFLVVSKHEEEWEYDLEGADDKIAFSYTKNLTYPEFSEFGSIGVKSVFGGLMRVN